MTALGCLRLVGRVHGGVWSLLEAGRGKEGCMRCMVADGGAWNAHGGAWWRMEVHGGAWKRKPRVVSHTHSCVKCVLGACNFCVSLGCLLLLVSASCLAGPRGSRPACWLAGPRGSHPWPGASMSSDFHCR
eukprot:358248-Chlamydomonas_euryale.AAC.4